MRTPKVRLWMWCPDCGYESATASEKWIGKGIVLFICSECNSERMTIDPYGKLRQKGIRRNYKDADPI